MLFYIKNKIWVRDSPQRERVRERVKKRQEPRKEWTGKANKTAATSPPSYPSPIEGEGIKFGVYLLYVNNSVTIFYINK